MNPAAKPRGGSPMVLALVQARMGSTRLPGKVLEDLGGSPMLAQVARRVAAASLVSRVCVATTISPSDDPIASYCAREGLDCFRGDEADVLDRFYQAARNRGGEVIVRVTADCPFIDPEVVDEVVAAYLAGGRDYVTNNLIYTYADGLDTEVFSLAALERSWKEARQPAEREHVTPYMKSPDRFRIANVRNRIDLGGRDLRWTVDTPEDLRFARAVYGRLSGRAGGFGQKEILELLAKEPAMSALNQGQIRNEGYYKSLAKEPPLPARPTKLENSLAWMARAEKVIPSCTQTFSKGPTQFVRGVAPMFLESAKGCRVWDVDGYEYIDYPLALGPVILGHNYPAVTEAVHRQIGKGVSFSLPHTLEVEVAEMLVEAIPCAEMVRFAKNGSDATAGAIRAARAITGRDMVACCGYHGWQDWYIGSTTRSRGVPESARGMTRHFLYNDPKSLQAIFDEFPGKVAAVIMEPMGVVVPQDGFLAKVKELAHANGALLVFDEVITGFRMGMGGAQEYFGVTPDLACFGKAMGNGYPISAVVGKREIMEIFDEIFFSFTFGGEAVSLAASKATITELRERRVFDHLWEQGQRLKDGFNVLAGEFGVAKHAECLGLPPRTAVSFKDAGGAESLELKSVFQQECLKRGVLFGGAHNLSFSHGPEDIDQTLRVYRSAFGVFSEAVGSGDPKRFLEGEAVKAVFRKV
jgi:glutamate-1-semialdehyde aminotransferase/spore coat polysaccharide biosynthesis protein SpsF (cytidylyltransferase family)